MHTIYAKNVNYALNKGLSVLLSYGTQRSSRAGDVLVVDGPVTTIYENPRERLLFNSLRDANPFFHFFESLWMLAGRNDVAYMENILPSFSQFSDDGEIFHGAYGFRWRKHWDFDQLKTIIDCLKTNSEDRRCVLTMWDPAIDLGETGKDFPCNTHIYFSISKGGLLDMTVCNRSNDIIWGAYGANAVHMSMLQEYIAGMIGCPVGFYWQISNNFHGYLDTVTPLKNLAYTDPTNPYEGMVRPFDMMSDPDRFMPELEMFLDEPNAIGYKTPFFRKVAIPLWKAFTIYKSDDKKKYRNAILEANTCIAEDWRMATVLWLERRYENSKR